MDIPKPKKLDKPLFEIKEDSIVKANGAGYYYCQTVPEYPAERAEKRDDRKAKYVYLHRAVYERSYGFIDEKNFQVDHIDGNKENNSLENLRICQLGDHQKSHTERGNHFWEKSPMNKKRTASANDLVQGTLKLYFGSI